MYRVMGEVFGLQKKKKQQTRQFQVSEKKFPNYSSMSYLQWTCKEWFFAKIV